MRIDRIDLSDVLRRLPDLQRLDVASVSSIDVLIIALGFEQRTAGAFLALLDADALRDTRVILIRYPTNDEDNSASYVSFDVARREGRIAGIEELAYEPGTFERKVGAMLGNLGLADGARIALDISTASSYVLHPLLRAIMDSAASLLVLYSEAGHYYPSREEWEAVAKRAATPAGLFPSAFEDADFQSIGVDRVYTSNLFSEHNPRAQPSCLVAVPNFSALRMGAIVQRDRELNKTKFSDIVWLIGEPPSEENKWRMEAVKETHDLTNVRSENLVSVSTLYYREVLKTLEGIWLDRRYKFHLSVGSLGSKLQHLAIFLFLWLHPDCGLWIAEPSKFKADRFSTGVGQIWMLDFGGVPDLRTVLDSYGTFALA